MRCSTFEGRWLCQCQAWRFISFICAHRRTDGLALTFCFNNLAALYLIMSLLLDLQPIYFQYQVFPSSDTGLDHFLSSLLSIDLPVHRSQLLELSLTALGAPYQPSQAVSWHVSSSVIWCVMPQKAHVHTRSTSLILPPCNSGTANPSVFDSGIRQQKSIGLVSCNHRPLPLSLAWLSLNSALSLCQHRVLRNKWTFTSQCSKANDGRP